MKGIIAWFADNGVAANLLMWVMIIGGLVAAPHIPQEVFPEFDTDRIIVSVPYPGAAPSEVEVSINQRIEERIGGVEGVKRVTSTAAEGNGAVTIEALAGTDVRALLDDIKAQVDAIDTFPEEAEEPLVQELILRRHVLSVAVAGHTDEFTLKRLAERVRNDLATLPGITQVELANARPYEISIEVAETVLRRYGLSFDEVADAVRNSSLDLPGGSVKTAAGEILLRTEGQAYQGPEFERIPLRTRADGTRLYLSDVATVVDGFADSDQSSRFDGKPSILVQVFRVGQQSALGVSSTVREYVAGAGRRLPEGITLTVWRDRSQVLRDRLATLRRAGLQGLVLVFLSLALFLRFRLALWVVLGIPLSFLGTLCLMPWLGLSINVLSLFSFILVLGIVVDDAIVVGENIYKKQEEGVDSLEAVISGTQEVSVPVIFGVLTTVAVFVPMFFMPGQTGKIMSMFPAVVIPTLLFSLVESQLILPSHLRHVGSGRNYTNPVSTLWKRVQSTFTSGLDAFIKSAYTPFLKLALQWRYVAATAMASVVIITVAMVGSGRVRVSFFPDAEADNVVAALTMPQGTPIEVTSAALLKLERSAERLREELTKAAGGRSAIQHVLRSVGEQPFTSARSSNGGRAGSAFSGTHVGEVNLELVGGDERPMDSASVAQRWRELTAPIPDALELTFSASLFSAGAAIDIQFQGPSFEHLTAAAARTKQQLAGYPGTAEITDSFRPGKQEATLSITPQGEALGLTLADLAGQLRQGFYGEEAQRVQRGREDIKVMVRYPEDERRVLASVENMRIRTPTGVEVPFATVASISFGRGYATIQRADRMRIVHVTADVDPNLADANRILADLKATLLPQLVSDYPSLSYTLEGEQREQRDTFGTLLGGMGVALLVIYALMAVPLRSYVHPLLVMSAIPPGIVGAVWAHILLGLSLSFMSIFGIIALIGVVVNDSLVLVDYANRQRDGGVPLFEAVMSAGVRRFRPILLTSLTTFAGLTPILLERSLQAQFLVPMAVSLGFGVVFATVISLVIVPCGYLVLDDLADLPSHMRSLWLQRRAEEPPQLAA